ncbi:Fis family transcriptional regulator [Neptunomonas sp. XY-337]|uniref:Fis family transcriptional regulator n=1 Tax=Neptunomonas sp. XY-337 TaxID=2561897 RepID=UPI0010A9D569|nr:Fis family transcriptional regulator [Neptunomonas sp. XY-337]
MRKTDKKIDNAIRGALTEVCEAAIGNFEGFKWLTHVVDYNCFPKSLLVVCVFETNDQLSSFLRNKKDTEVFDLIKFHLKDIPLNIKDISKHVDFDTEENCTNKNNGNWRERLH